MRLTDYPLAVVVAHATGCGHCAEFLPRVQPVAAMYADKVATILVNIVEAPYLLDGLKIEGTPATVVIRNGRIQPDRLDGAVDDYAIHEFYESVAGSVEDSDAVAA